MSMKTTRIHVQATNETINGLVASAVTCTKPDEVIDLNYIDVSNVTDMEGLFNYMPDITVDVSEWDVSNVLNMVEMFKRSKCKCDVSKWDVSSVVRMDGMFSRGVIPDGIEHWNVKNVQIMSSMFLEAHSSIPYLGNWDVSNVTDMNCMFKFSSVHDNGIGNWDVSKVHDMGRMFMETMFSGDLSKWNVSSVTTMRGMFYGSPFNGDISKWNVGHVTDMAFMFTGSEFNQDISKWDCSHVSCATNMFGNTKYQYDITFPFTYRTPEDNRIGYKKVIIDSGIDAGSTVIAELEIPEDATVISVNTEGRRKCRTNKCIVKHFIRLGDYVQDDTITAHSDYDKTFKYHVGDVIEIPDFDTNRWNQCSNGIHFFYNFRRAEQFDL